jgi:hypothetical protein
VKSLRNSLSVAAAGVVLRRICRLLWKFSEL